MMKNAPSGDLRTDYADPVRRLLILGKTRGHDPAEWLDYVTELGLGREHIAELIRLACDSALNWGNPDSSVVWAPVHAWRALGQLQAEEAAAPLLIFLRTAEAAEDETAEGELPAVLGMIGPAAIPPIASFLADRSNPTVSAVTAMEGLKEIVARHPECRGDCIGILAQVLDWHVDADPTINGFAVWALIDLRAVEAIDAMREAFRRKSIDISIAGDEEAVEIALGLRERRVTPKPRPQILHPDRLARPADRPHSGAHRCAVPTRQGRT